MTRPRQGSDLVISIISRETVNINNHDTMITSLYNDIMISSYDGILVYKTVKQPHNNKKHHVVTQ